MIKKIGAFLGIALLCGCEHILYTSSGSQDTTTIPSDSSMEDDTRIPEPAYVYDNFSTGVNHNKWYISKRNWSAAVSQGQRVENVNYTAEGDLILSAKGSYYEDFMKTTGGVIVSKEALGPGKYEIAMKLLPRLGVCNAFWTYSYLSDNENYEIDIELPGNKSYDHIIHTNWTGVNEGQYTSTVSEVTPLNDNKWHKYTFEWKTSPEEVKYYIDDQLITTSTTNVPTTKGNLWCGAWLPNRWCGDSNFYEDYMLVDWIGYEAYLDQPARDIGSYVNQVASKDEYPTSPIQLPSRNYISNGKFSNGVAGFDGDITIINGQGNIQSSCSQTIEEVYEGYTYQFKLKGKGLAKTNKVIFKFYNRDDCLVQSESLLLFANELQEFKKNLTAPEDSKKLVVVFEGSDLIIQDVELTNA